MEMMLDKKQIWEIFLFDFKMVKQQRRLATSTMYLAHKLLMNIECSGGSRSFAKERFKDEECSGCPLEVDNH